MSRLVSRTLVLAGVASLLPCALLPQQDEKSVVRESTGATVIEVPVNVVGKDGKPMRALKASDFELYDNGKAQSITGFDVIDLGAPPPAAQSGQARPETDLPAAARRLWLLVFDLSYTSPTGLLRAREGARAFVTNSMKGEDLAAVGTLSVDTGWKLLVNFTRDRQQLASAVETLGLPGASVQRASDPLAFAFELTNPSGSPTGGGSTAGMSSKEALMLENLRDLQVMQRQANDDFSRGRVSKLVNSLAGIGRTLDAVRGKKHVLFFSEGFETRLLAGSSADSRSSSLQAPSSSSLDTSTPQGASEAALSGQIWRIDSDARFGSSSTRNRMTEALAWFKRSDAVLDAVDISGLRADGDVGPAKAGSGTDALFTMSAETDGQLVKNANQLGPELERVSERTSVVYLLAFQPRSLTKPGTFHALQVKVKAPGAKSFARSGYYEPRPYRSLSPFEQLLASGDLLTGGARQNEFPISLLASSFPSVGGLAQVPVVLEIPGRTLLANDPGPKSSLQVYAYATDESGTLRDYFTQEVTLDLDRARAGIEAGGLKFMGNLTLAPGSYSVRTLVRHVASGRSAVASTRLTVPEIPGSTPTVLPPFFEEPAGRWTMVKVNPRADAPPRPADYPFSLGGETFIPSAVPIVSGPTQIAVMTFNLGTASTEPLQVLSEVFGSDGKPRAAQVEVVRRVERERGGGRGVLLALKPEGLAPGRYLLKVRLSDRVSRKTAAASTDFEVRTP